MEDHLAFERSYWGDCCNTFDEDQKHYIYAKYMGLSIVNYSFNVLGSSVLDIGGGPSSMLLKCINLKRGMVWDPITYPQWTVDRYQSKSIDVTVAGGEIMYESGWDEVWLYNCLQHVEDPSIILFNAVRSAKILRIFEWVDVPAHDGHPHTLTKESLDGWIGKEGSVVTLATQGCYGNAYHGVFYQ